MGANQDSKPPANPIRTTHLDSGWVDEPTFDKLGPNKPPVIAPDEAVPEPAAPTPAEDPPASEEPTDEPKRFESLSEETEADDPFQLPPPPPRPVASKRVLGKPSVPPPPGMGMREGPPPPGMGMREGPPPRRFDGPRDPSPPLPAVPEASVEVPSAPVGPSPAAASGPPAGPASQPPQPIPQQQPFATPQTPAPFGAQPPANPAVDPPQLAPAAPPAPFPAQPTMPTAQAPSPYGFTAPPGHAATLTLGEALCQRVRLGGASVPSWSISLALILAVAVPVGLLGALAGASARATMASPDTAAASSPPVAPVAPPQDAPPVAEMAAAGDPAAMKALSTKPAGQRTLDESIALANGMAVERKAALAALATDLGRNPALADDPDVLRRVREAADDAELSRDALRILASLPGPQSADIVYQTWVGTSQRTLTTELAEELVYCKDVRSKASPALAVALDLRRAATCDQVAEILPRAVEHGDRRSMHLLGRLVSRRGCGKGKQEDCYPCLRDDDALADAIKAVRMRQPPAY